MQITFPAKPKVIKQENNRAVFEIEGCYPGYGITLGNALRRALLSSLKGAAITGVKIKGAQHEFSNIPHVLESVLDIILNLKKIRLKSHSDQPVKIFLKANGEKEVRAKDIEKTADVEIINKDAYIAALTDKKAELDMELEVSSGLGYETVDSRKKDRLEIGKIAIDAIFSPVQKVNFEVGNMRVGERTDFNKLKLDVETDGSISPVEAFEKAAQILVEHFKIFTDLTEKEEKIGEETEGKKSSKAKDASSDDTKTKVEDLKLSTRTITALAEAGIKTVSGLIKKKEDDLVEIKGMGDKGIKEIKKVLKKLGLTLKT
jgi:DNA-directed RNA polymerase subunit alpha